MIGNKSCCKGYSLSLLKSFLELLVLGAGSLAIPIGLLWALEVAGILSLRAVLSLSLPWPFLLGDTIVALATFWLLDRLLHKLAFSTHKAQISLADLEDLNSPRPDCVT